MRSVFFDEGTFDQDVLEYVIEKCRERGQQIRTNAPFTRNPGFATILASDFDRFANQLRCLLLDSDGQYVVQLPTLPRHPED